MKDRLKEKYLPSFYRTHLVDQMLNLRQSGSCLSDYINAVEDLIQRCELVEDPSLTIARFIRSLRPDLKRDVTLSSPFTLDEAYHKALEVENLNKPVLVRRATLLTKFPTQVIFRKRYGSCVALLLNFLQLFTPRWAVRVCQSKPY